MFCLLHTTTFLILFLTSSTFANLACGDWEPYKDEKCVRVFHDMLAYEDAVKACKLASADAHLLTIRSAEEQEFMDNWLFKTHSVRETLWLGAKFDKVKFFR